MLLNGFIRLTNDHGQWILPMALSTGNNEGTFAQLGNATRFRMLRINAEGDSANYDFSNGRGWKGLVSGLNFDYGLGKGWTVRDNLSYTSGNANTLGLVPNGSPMTISTLLGKLGTSSIMTQGGKTLTSGYVQSYGFWVVQKHLESITNDISLTNEIANHKITLGAYQAFWSSQDFWTIGNHALVQNIANGDIIKNVSPDSVAGSWNYGLNESGDSRIFAVYAGDSWQATDKLRFDFGARYDFFNLNFTLDAGSWPDGTIDKIASLDGNDWAGTFAINYSLNNTMGIFGRASKGSLYPNFDQVRDGDLYNLKSGMQIRDAGGSVINVNGTVKPNLFNQFEAGLKVDKELYSLFLTAFLNTVEVYDGDVGASRVSALLKTRTVGAEIDAGLYVGQFRANLIGTFQSGEITQSDQAPETVGNKIWRQPNFQFRFAPSYEFPLSDGINGSIYGALRYVGKRWDDRDNVFQLDAFSKLDAGVEVTTKSGLSFNLYADNLNDSHGLTEGDPRDPSASNGRPILGRSIRFSIGVNF